LLKIPIGQLSIDGGIAVKINKPHTARAAGGEAPENLPLLVGKLLKLLKKIKIQFVRFFIHRCNQQNNS